MPKEKDKKKKTLADYGYDEEDFADDPAYDAGWMDLIAAIASGANRGAGSDTPDYLTKRSLAIGEDIDRRNLERDREHQREREAIMDERAQRQEDLQAAEILSETFAALGLPESPFGAGAGPSGLSFDPNASAGLMTTPPAIESMATAVAPGREQVVTELARTLANTGLLAEAQTYSRDLGRRIEERKVFDEMDIDKQIRAEERAAVELSDVRQTLADENFKEWMRQESVRQRHDLAARAYSASLGERPNVARTMTSAQGLAFEYATRLRDSWRGGAELSSQTGWHDVIRRWMEPMFGDTLTVGEISDAIGKAVDNRYPTADEIAEQNRATKKVPGANEEVERATAQMRFGRTP